MQTQHWLKAILTDHWLKEMWPPSSPDCNPVDYFMWSVIEREVSKCPHNTLASLKAKVSDVMTDLGREVIIHACKMFWSWIKPGGFHQTNVYVICI
jgi:hypothetical protein